MGLKKLAKKAVRSVSNVVKSVGQGGKDLTQGIKTGDFKRAAGGALNLGITGAGFALGGPLVPGALGGMAANKLYRKMTQQQGYTNPYDADARAMQQGLINQRLGAAQDFQDGLGQRIGAEAADLRQNLSRELGTARKAITADANRRGMVFSGNRMKKEGGAIEQAGQMYQQGLGEIISKNQGQAQAMMADPLMSQANVNESGLRQQTFMQDLANQRGALAAQLAGQGMGMIGQGVGTGLANRQSGKSFWGS